MAPAKPDSPRQDPNLDIYNSPPVTAHYAELNYLTPCEHMLFETYLKPGMAILDLGVGGGRTTPYLSAIAGRYVGADYAERMIAICRKKFPHLVFEVANASDLSKFLPSSFDAVVMAFNSMDYVLPDESRFKALQEIGRVLKPEGVFVFSSHNTRALLLRPEWNPQRLQDLARRTVSQKSLLYRPLLWTLTVARATAAVFQSLVRSLILMVRRLPTRVFWSGDGSLLDPVHGGLITHYSTPRTVEQELRRFGFHRLRVMANDYPRASHPLLTAWYYYVFAKGMSTGEP